MRQRPNPDRAGMKDIPEFSKEGEDFYGKQYENTELGPVSFRTGITSMKSISFWEPIPELREKKREFSSQCGLPRKGRFCSREF